MTTQKVEEALEEVARRETDYENACLELAEKEHLFKVEQAKAFLKADGTVDFKKNTALVQCEAMYGEFLKADAVKAFTKEKLKDAQDALSARQSLLKYDGITNFGYTQHRS